tara:strand:- start:376 stop:486 length:111 start_codon:yes stop_codon:yes gene_type:complete
MKKKFEMHLIGAKLFFQILKIAEIPIEIKIEPLESK